MSEIKWNIVTEKQPEHGFEVLGYNKSWIDEDYNADGICMCFLQDGNPDYWVISKWCGYHDEWHTRDSKEALDNLGEANEMLPYIDAPTHWIEKPKFNI